MAEQSPIQIDHIAIGAADVSQAARLLGQQWGVEIPFGGRHAAMSTFNHLAGLGGDRYLEIIGVDPEAPAPGRPRWFSLDQASTRQGLAVGPRPLCWVVRVDDLDRLVADSPIDPGEILSLTRDDLAWRLTVPADGGLPGDGLLPAFIEWPPGPHPAARMADPGLRLLGVVLEHPAPQRISADLRALGVDHLASVTRAAEPRLRFEIETPLGRRLL